MIATISFPLKTHIDIEKMDYYLLDPSEKILQALQNQKKHNVPNIGESKSIIALQFDLQKKKTKKQEFSLALFENFEQDLMKKLRTVNKS